MHRTCIFPVSDLLLSPTGASFARGNPDLAPGSPRAPASESTQIYIAGESEIADFNNDGARDLQAA